MMDFSESDNGRLSVFLCPGDNSQKLIDLQACPPYQSTIDIRLPEEFGGVIGLDTPPILDNNALG